MNNNPAPTDEDKERYYEIVKWAAERGLTLTMHWGPDSTVHHLLEIFERVNREVPIADLRWSIAHLNDASSTSLERMHALGVGWTVQDAMYFGGDALVRTQGADAGKRIPPVMTGKRLGVAIGARHRRAPRRVVQPVHVAAVVPRRQDRRRRCHSRPGGDAWPRGRAALLHAGQRMVLVRRRRARLARGRQARRPRRVVGGLPHRARRGESAASSPCSRCSAARSSTRPRRLPRNRPRADEHRRRRSQTGPSGLLAG